uniref:Four and a half LIM domains 1 n=1 Tax=Nothobranchius furzeri TaxID=105023 RepID=A0A8C6NNH6_NOTFU
TLFFHTHLNVTMADSSHCFYCREDLGGKRFVRSEGRPVCVRCHTKFCANSCVECHRPISVETKELSHKGRYWHEECFRCAKCYKPLAKEPFNTKDDRIMCVRCCSKEDAPCCHGHRLRPQWLLQWWSSESRCIRTL